MLGLGIGLLGLAIFLSSVSIPLAFSVVTIGILLIVVQLRSNAKEIEKTLLLKIYELEKEVKDLTKEQK